ncbi:MAG: hypothetical protein WBA59_04010 [Moheibacter sp.]
MTQLTELEKQTIEAAEEYIKTIGSSTGMGYKETIRKMIEFIREKKVSERDLKHLLEIYKNKNHERI